MPKPHKDTTVQELFASKLIQLGFSEKQAESALDKGKAYLDALSDDYKIKWNYSYTHYEERLLNVMFLTMRPAILQWIDDNIPMAWFRPIFL